MIEHGLKKTDEAAKYLGFSPITLAIWRHKKIGPDYVKLGRKVGYTQEQLDAFIEKGIVTN